jgi:hypothetical protein
LSGLAPGTHALTFAVRVGDEEPVSRSIPIEIK